LTTYIALLRGINVGGHQPVKMAALQASCAALGFTDARTYLQSGNLVFGAPQAPPARVAERLTERLRHDLGLSLAVLVKPGREWKALAEGNPFLREAGIDTAKLHATLPFEPPSAAAWAKLATLKPGRDRLAVADGAIYLHCPDGYGRSKLSNNLLERALGVSATTRNWKTVTALNGMAAE
jgi:uncharacterized protein (DUF1697 family)